MSSENVRAGILQALEDYGIATNDLCVDWDELAASVADVATRDLQRQRARALIVAQDYGQTDGAHHRLWVIDQMVRALTGDDYAVWCMRYRVQPDGTLVDPWDEGIAP